MIKVIRDASNHLRIPGKAARETQTIEALEIRADMKNCKNPRRLDSGSRATSTRAKNLR
jgi:hypothetical protein